LTPLRPARHRLSALPHWRHNESRCAKPPTPTVDFATKFCPFGKNPQQIPLRSSCSRLAFGALQCGLVTPQPASLRGRAPKPPPPIIDSARDFHHFATHLLRSPEFWQPENQLPMILVSPNLHCARCFYYAFRRIRPFCHPINAGFPRIGATTFLAAHIPGEPWNMLTSLVFSECGWPLTMVGHLSLAA